VPALLDLSRLLTSCYTSDYTMTLFSSSAQAKRRM